MSNRAIVIITIIILIIVWTGLGLGSGEKLLASGVVIFVAFWYWMFCEIGENMGREIGREREELNNIFRFGTEEEKQTALMRQILKEQERTNRRVAGLGFLHFFDDWFK